MADSDNQIAIAQATSASDAEAIRHLEQAILGGKHWYLALLEAMALWTSAEEDHNGRTYRYLIDGEAFDWLLLAERLCEAVDGWLPGDEKKALLFQGKPPLSLSAREVRGLIGDSKYRHYLNYFYGFTVEGTLLLAVQEEVYKERQACRIYGADKSVLLKQFRKEKGYRRRRSITLAELKEFTYWLFKYRLKNCEKARVASDTRKALQYLKHQWTKKGFSGVLVADESLAD